MGTTALKSQATLPLFTNPEVRHPSRARNGEDLLVAVETFSFNGEPTVEESHDGLRYFTNEFWTSGQRQAHSIHEISYRACFKPQLPRFFIERLTGAGETVYDPFSGRGTTRGSSSAYGTPACCQ